MSRGADSCPPWCTQHHEVGPEYGVHRGPDLIVRSDTGAPLARVGAVLGTVSGEDFGPQVQVDLITTRVVEDDGYDTYAQAAFSPEETQRFAAALTEAADALEGYPRP